MNAIMSDSEFRQNATPVRNDWEGFAEVDRAIAENRLGAYQWNKTWADPIGRIVTILVLGAFVAFAAFVIVNDLIL